MGSEKKSQQRKREKGEEGWRAGRSGETSEQEEPDWSSASRLEPSGGTTGCSAGPEECHTALVLRLTLLITTPPRWSAERLTRSVHPSLRTAGASAELAHISRRHSVHRELSLSPHLRFDFSLTAHKGQFVWTCVFLSELFYIWKHHEIKKSRPQFVLKQCSAYFSQ